jgi:hypothetical protein
MSVLTIVDENFDGTKKLNEIFSNDGFLSRMLIPMEF